MKRDTPISSPTRELQQNKKETNIFVAYQEIKSKNLALKASTFTQFWKQTATSQHRLLLAFDLEKGRMQIAFLEPKVSKPWIVDDHKKSILSFDTDTIHTIDQMDLHK